MPGAPLFRGRWPQRPPFLNHLAGVLWLPDCVRGGVIEIPTAHRWTRRPPTGHPNHRSEAELLAAL